MFERYRQTCKPYGRKAVMGIFFRVSGRELLSDNFTQGKGEKTHDGGTALVSQDKCSGNAFVAMLPRSGFEKCIELHHAAIKTCAVMLFR